MTVINVKLVCFQLFNQVLYGLFLLLEYLISVVPNQEHLAVEGQDKTYLTFT